MRPLYTRNFALAVAGQSLFVLANSIVLTHFARWVVFLHGDERDIGWITAVGSAVGLLLRPWLGQWIDRVGTRATWAAGYAVFVPSTLAYLLLDDLGPFIFVLRTATYVGSALVFSSTLTYVTQFAPAERRTEAIGVLGAGGFLGMIVGPSIGEFWLHGAERHWSDFAGLFGSAAAAICLASLFLPFQKAPPPETTAPVEGEKFWPTVFRYWPGTILLVNLIFGLCMTIPFGFLAKYVDIIGGADVGVFFWLYAGWGLFVRLFFRQLPDQIGRRKVLLVGLLFMGVGMLSYLLVDAEHTWRLFIPALMCGTGHSLIFHTMTALAIDAFPPKSRGTGMVLSLMVQDFGMIAGAPVLGFIAFHFGYAWLFSIVGVGCLLAGALYVYSVVAARRQRPAARAIFLAPVAEAAPRLESRCPGR